MKILSIKEYFNTFIWLNNVLVRKDDKLTHKEVDFFVECCLFNFNGGDLNQFDLLADHILELRLLKNRNACSVYKHKLAAARWIKSKREMFQLPKHLDILDGGDHFLVWKGDKRVKTKQLTIKMVGKYDYPIEGK